MPRNDAAARVQSWISEEIHKVEFGSMLTTELRDHLAVIEQKIDDLDAKVCRWDSKSEATGMVFRQLRASTHLPTMRSRSEAWAKDSLPERPRTAPAAVRNSTTANFGLEGSPSPPVTTPPHVVVEEEQPAPVKVFNSRENLALPSLPGSLLEEPVKAVRVSDPDYLPRPEKVSRMSSVMSGERKRYGKLRSWLRLSSQDEGVLMSRYRSGRSNVGGVRGLQSVQALQSWLAEYVADRTAENQNNAMWKFVKGMQLQVLTSAMIVLNVVLIGVVADDRLKKTLSGNELSPAWDVVEICFACFFSVELLLRLLVERSLFVVGPEWKWNLFDSILVIFSTADLILSKATDVELSDVTAARAMRFIRFARIIRIARAVRAFHSLRVVVFGIFQSIASLFWCLIVVGLIIYMFAILFLYGVTEHLANSSFTDTASSELLKYFGSVPKACTSLFMTISGGVDWEVVVTPLEEIHWIYQPTFTLYVFLMSIGVLNVVMGAFVTATAEIAKTDRELIIRNEMNQMETYTQKIRMFFEEADQDKSGMLSWHEFKNHLKVPRVQAYFQALQLDVSQAHVVFKLLDRDGSNEVSLDEFIAGCVRLKGEARALEVNMLLWENKRLFGKLTELFGVLNGEEISARVSARVSSRVLSTRQSTAPEAAERP